MFVGHGKSYSDAAFNVMLFTDTDTDLMYFLTSLVQIIIRIMSPAMVMDRT